MKLQLALLGVAFVACAAASEVRAQAVYPGGMTASVPYYSPVAYGTSAYGNPPAVNPLGWPYGAYTPRVYVGYGNDDIFAYRGRFYGKPYDPWTWEYMSGAYQAGLARYYYPPVP